MKIRRSTMFDGETTFHKRLTHTEITFMSKYGIQPWKNCIPHIYKFIRNVLVQQKDNLTRTVDFEHDIKPLWYIVRYSSKVYQEVKC